MKNKLILFAAAIVLFLGVFYLIYDRFSPSNPQLAAELNKERHLNSDNFTEFLKQEPGTYVFFLDDGSTDAQYISTSLIIPLSLEFENALPEIQPVLFENNQMSVVSMKKTYKVENLPAFVIIETTDDQGGYNIVSSLSYNKDKPFDAKDLRAWFHENNLWNAPFASN